MRLIDGLLAFLDSFGEVIEDFGKAIEELFDWICEDL